MNAPTPLDPTIMPKLYGSATVGERGQIVVPQDARVELGLRTGDKLLAFGGPSGVNAIVLIKEESFHSILAEISRKMSGLEHLLGAAGITAAGTSAPDVSRAVGGRRPVIRRASPGKGRSRR
jgi:AbrB family looped-hinge helix DNA binding protein